ncbi:UDP-N-acetylmuramoyl-L-alanyl-D-glutamate--2,6-diaminopimelate ligase [Paenibacillus gansuensis]|uniref:UDP-N-acetylmuramyl-tripeptide synthetase n=1 Tax=Paenibacillus gansuensis TaxID=306542 RepID=A0ABW5PCY7_9BACL
MLLSSLIHELDYVKLQGPIYRNVSAIAFDSREVQTPNTLFVAISGFASDGHLYIDQAISKGASTIIVEKDVEVSSSVTIIQVKDARRALALLSDRFYGRPTERLNLIGITGTNGKTSTAYFIKSIYEQAGQNIGVISTIGTMIGDTLSAQNNTTPESLYLQQTFADMVAANIDHCAMEVSSHALNLQRVAYSRFNTGIFTNLSPDHLELHHDMEQYFQAKAQLFRMTSKHNIINADDPYGRRLISMCSGYSTEFITYGIDHDADIYASDIQYFADHSLYTLNTPSGRIDIKVNLPGTIYVYNTLAAISCAYADHLSLHDIKEGISAVTSIKGRFEVIHQDEDRKVIVDFAHTEDGLEKALLTLRPFAKGRILLVFGVYAADGETGKRKRSAMARVAAKLADLSIVTSDNPKEQNPEVIIEEISNAISKAEGNYYTRMDRKEAIELALKLSGPGDIILIAGKGHETSQIIGSREIPFDEAQIVQDFFKGGVGLSSGV